MYLVPFSFGVLSVVPNFVRLLIFEILGYTRGTDEGFALVARFLHDSRLVERSAAEFAQEHHSTEYRRRSRVRYMGHLHKIAFDLKAPSGVESLMVRSHAEPRLKSLAVNCTARLAAWRKTPRRQWKPWAEAVRHRSAAPREEAPVRDVRAGSADGRREPQTTEGRGTQEPLRDLGPNINH